MRFSDFSMAKRARSRSPAKAGKKAKTAEPAAERAEGSPSAVQQFAGTTAELDVIARSRLISKDSVMGNDASVTRCVQAFMPFARAVTAKRSSGDGPDAQRLAHKFLRELDRFGVVVARASRIKRTASKELTKCKAREGQITQSIEQTREAILQLKQELQVARAVRHNNEACEALAKLVAGETDRATITADMDALQTELDTLQGEGSAHAAKIARIQTQCQVLMHALHDFRAVVAEGALPAAEEWTTLENKQ